ncbi:MAG: hypothetical protein HEP71_17445 [Roseivirga sp.]|nr:hypothetical protein [Roseivirga sp.]
MIREIFHIYAKYLAYCFLIWFDQRQELRISAYLLPPVAEAFGGGLGTDGVYHFGLPPSLPLISASEALA